MLRPFGHFATIIYTKTGTCAAFAHFRKHLHQSFLLPPDRPYFRRQNKFVFAEDKKTVGTGPLMNVHVGLPKPGTCHPKETYLSVKRKNGFSTKKYVKGVKGSNFHGGFSFFADIGGEVSLVYGAYTYYHYMQDKFNDDGWGCAYRSLQTLISWFRLQGYTETKNPTHSQVISLYYITFFCVLFNRIDSSLLRFKSIYTMHQSHPVDFQIQKCLVKLGDKPKDFIDSKQWIGSTEVGYVLEESTKIQSMFLSVSSGEELASKGRELSQHFKKHGTPVMIGRLF